MEAIENRIIIRIINSNKALADCQMKTAGRVKTIAEDHPALVADVKEIKNLVSTAKRKAWEVGLSALKWIALGGGLGEFIRYYCTGKM